MRRPIKASVTLCIAAFLAVSASAAPKNEYFTENELDLIREAQDLNVRIPTYLKLAERRLVFLGIMPKSQERVEQEKKEKEKRIQNDKKKPNYDSRANADKAPIDDTSYLEDFTGAELLRGYIQALDETMTNIDDAYSRKQDVRDPVEDLAKFTNDTIPLLQKYSPKNASERSALQDAIEKATQAQTDAQAALKIVPKTEKKHKP